MHHVALCNFTGTGTLFVTGTLSFLIHLTWRSAYNADAGSLHGVSVLSLGQHFQGSRQAPVLPHLGSVWCGSGSFLSDFCETDHNSIVALANGGCSNIPSAEAQMADHLYLRGSTVPWTGSAPYSQPGTHRVYWGNFVRFLHILTFFSKWIRQSPNM